MKEVLIHDKSSDKNSLFQKYSIKIICKRKTEWFGIQKSEKRTGIKYLNYNGISWQNMILAFLNRGYKNCFNESKSMWFVKERKTETWRTDNRTGNHWSFCCLNVFVLFSVFVISFSAFMCAVFVDCARISCWLNFTYFSCKTFIFQWNKLLINIFIVVHKMAKKRTPL